MALNGFEMIKFSEGSTGTGGRVDELTLPVDTSHRSRSQQTRANEKDLNLELNLQKEIIGAGPSGGSSEDDELVHPVSESRSEAEVDGRGHVTVLEPIREEDEDDGGRTHQPVGDPENTNHTVTVEESESDHFCRICGPDEEIPEPDNLLVKLGCNCRGSLCWMHRKCILEWYGPRFCMENNYKCELCNALLHVRTEFTVFRALIGRDSGTEILIKALRSRAPRRSRRRRRHASVAAAPTQESARPAESHQINIVEITHPGSRQDNSQYYGSTRAGYLMCVMVFIIMVLIGFAVAGIGKLHR